jgi:cytochrome c oxidase subunit II
MTRLRKSTLAVVAGLALLVAAAIAAAFAHHERSPQVVRISVKRFTYAPAEFVLKKGMPTVLELRSEDVVHGFNAPDLGVRADIVPGQVVRVRVVPGKAGRFVFHCDIFCGTGHEELQGIVTVIE